MAENVKDCKVFIASPGDVKEERLIVREICRTLNGEKLVTKDHIRFKAMGWEDVPPEAGRPQEIINRMVDKCDIFICVFFRRFGSDTGKVSSGTLEEIQRAYDNWKVHNKPHIMLYFKEVKISSAKDLKDKQLLKVLEYKDEVDEKKLFWSRNFSDLEQFKEQVTDHLKDWIIKQRSTSQDNSLTPPPAPTPQKAPEELFSDYKEYALKEHRFLPLQGFETNIRANIEIEHVYVTMRAHVQHLDFKSEMEVKKRAKARPGKEELPDLDIRGMFSAAQKQKVKDIVILGDPGSGKTTLLKYILVMLLDGKGKEKLGLDKSPIPFFAPLRELKDPGKEDFLDFICRHCCVEKQDISREDVKKLLKQKKGIILLDGIDEVADEKARLQTCRWIDAARREFVHTPFVVTSRFTGYLGESRLQGGALELAILDFTPDEVESFLLRWFETVEVALHPGGKEEGWRKRGRKHALELIKDIESSPHIRKLAVNPLMLQIIALVRFDRGTKLPERQVELYNECVNVLLENWNVAKGLPILLSAREYRRLLQPLALWLHGEEGRRSAPYGDIVFHLQGQLESLGRSGLDIGKLLFNIRDRSGIFLGYSESEYGFAHLGFQEYLAAEEVRNERRVDLLIANYGNRWWRELTRLSLALDNPSIIKEFIQEIVKQDAFTSDITLVSDAIGDSLVKPHEALVEALGDVGLGREVRQNVVRLLSQVWGPSAEQALKEAVKDEDISLAHAAYSVLKAQDADAGIEAPSLLLPGSLTYKKDNSEMVLIPGGNFLYGSREDDKFAHADEKPQQTIYLPAYYMDVYPVTNGQFCLFLNEKNPSKKELERWISLSGSSDYEKCRIEKKRGRYVVESGYENFPVIYVSWYGAVFYSDWVGKRLPFEVEWEKAARGTDGRIYPWGNEFDQGLCNSGESGLRHTTEVGSYPGGKSPFGCYDMAGNVWEWCADKWDENNDKTGKELVFEPGGGSYRVLRGGAWGSDAELVRCAFRGGLNPGVRVYNTGLRLARTP